MFLTPLRFGGKKAAILDFGILHDTRYASGETRCTANPAESEGTS